MFHLISLSVPGIDQADAEELVNNNDSAVSLVVLEYITTGWEHMN